MPAMTMATTSWMAGQIDIDHDEIQNELLFGNIIAKMDRPTDAATASAVASAATTSLASKVN